MRADLDYIDIAITAIEDILSYVDDNLGNLTEDAFLGNKMMRNAMLMHLVVVGEALGKVRRRHNPAIHPELGRKRNLHEIFTFTSMTA